MEAVERLKQNGTIYYIIPDIHRRKFKPIPLLKAIVKGTALAHIKKYWFRKHKPIGGVKVMLQHCLLLQEMGFDAKPLRLGRYEGNFFGYPTTSVSISDVSLNLGEYDVVVCPEICPRAALKFSGGHKVLFAQNWVHLYEDNKFRSEQIFGPYVHNGFSKVMCCSQYLVSKLTREPAGDVCVVNNFIDLSCFRRDDEKRVPGRVLALPRKRPEDLAKVMEILEGEGVDFRLADSLPQSELIKEYQAADIFIATGYPEGFGLPPLEAMACGAVVVGFTGGGASEFMRDGDTALVVEDGDCDQLAQRLKQLLADPALKARLRESSNEVVQAYNKERTKRELFEFFVTLAESTVAAQRSAIRSDPN